ncbi:MAG: ABC transporter permease, partial [Dongiaceae bacterium]
MRHPMELWIGLRYTRAKRRTRFISFISIVSIVCMAIGVWALIVVLSVMNGFERELRARILGMASHATISAFEGGLPGWRGVAERAAKNPEIEALAPYVQGEGMLRMSGALSGTLMRGVLPEAENRVSEVGRHMTQGALTDLKPGEFRIVLGSQIARALGVRSGDKVDLMIPQASVTPAGVLPRFRRFTVSGIFEIGMYEFDRGLVLIHLADAQALYR